MTSIVNLISLGEVMEGNRLIAEFMGIKNTTYSDAQTVIRLNS